jgi:fructose-1-phosphate kinase PfkB-like protein
MGAEGCVMNGVKHSITPVKDPINTIGAGDCFYAALLATGDPNFANKKASEYVSNNIERD